MTMTLDEMISVFKNGDLQDIDYELMINAEQLLYWLTEYRAMISGRHSDNLSERLAEHLVWAESNSYECPVTLAEDLQEAISVIATANKVIESHDSKVAELEAVIYGMDGEINRLQSKSSWISCVERMPDEPGIHVMVTDGVHIMESWYELIDGETLWIDNCINVNFGEVTHWKPIPELPKEG